MIFALNEEADFHGSIELSGEGDLVSKMVAVCLEKVRRNVSKGVAIDCVISTLLDRPIAVEKERAFAILGVLDIVETRNSAPVNMT